MNTTSRYTTALQLFLVANGITIPVLAHGQSDPGNFTTVVDVPPAVIGDDQSIGSNTQLNLWDGGTIGARFRAGAEEGTSSNIEVNLFGGTTGETFVAYAGSTVNVVGGTIGELSAAHSGSIVNMSGGAVGESFSTVDSTMNVSGGSVARLFGAYVGSTVNISGGFIDDHFLAYQSTVSMSGGAVGDNFDVRSGSIVHLTGGSIADGFEVDSDSTMSIFGGSVGDDAQARSRSTVNIYDGMVGNSFDVSSESTINVMGGVVGNDFSIDSRSVANISGGTIGDDFHAKYNTTVNVSGGTIGDRFRAYFDSPVTISGGSFGADLVLGYHPPVLRVVAGSAGEEEEPDTVGPLGGDIEYTALISGGTFGDSFQFRRGVLGLVGSDFLLDGEQIAGLVPGEPMEIPERDVTLSGTLADGSPFRFDLNSDWQSGQDYFSPGSTLLITQAVPEPSALVLAVAAVAVLAIRLPNQLLVRGR